MGKCEAENEVFIIPPDIDEEQDWAWRVIASVVSRCGDAL